MLHVNFTKCDSGTVSNFHNLKCLISRSESDTTLFHTELKTAQKIKNYRREPAKHKFEETDNHGRVRE